jgi:hypothetical protein
MTSLRSPKVTALLDAIERVFRGPRKHIAWRFAQPPGRLQRIRQHTRSRHVRPEPLEDDPFLFREIELSIHRDPGHRLRHRQKDRNLVLHIDRSENVVV